MTIVAQARAVPGTDAVSVDQAWHGHRERDPWRLGTHAITAVYAGDADFNATNGSFSPTVTCTTTLTGTIRGGLSVPTGSSACTSASPVTVNGRIKVQPGGALYLNGATVHGGITSSGATELALCASTVKHAIDVSGTTGFVLLGDGGEDGCTGNELHGGSTLSSNQAGLEESGNCIDGAITVAGNTVDTGARTEDGGLAANVVEGNTITGSQLQRRLAG